MSAITSISLQSLPQALPGQGPGPLRPRRQLPPLHGHGPHLSLRRRPRQWRAPEGPHPHPDLGSLVLRARAEGARPETPPAIPVGPGLSSLDARGTQPAAWTNHDLPQAEGVPHCKSSQVASRTLYCPAKLCENE